MPANAFIIPAGYSRRKVRDFLRRYAEWRVGGFSRQTVVEWFGKDIIDDLLAQKLIEPAREKHYSRTDDVTDGEIIAGYYRVALVGRRFASKLLIPPISRAKADQIIADLLKRARAVNRNPKLLFYVREIRVFGSYLTDAQELGDIDICIEFDRKIDCYEKFKQAAIARARTQAPFRYFYLASDEVDYVMNEVRKLLKNRDPYLSFLSSRLLLDELDTPKRVIFSSRNLRR